jgi:hypothetical protein
VVVVDKFRFQFWPYLGGRWSQLTGGRCSEVVLVLILRGRDLGWSLLTGGRYSEVVVSTGLHELVQNILKRVVTTRLFKNIQGN